MRQRPKRRDLVSAALSERPRVRAPQSRHTCPACKHVGSNQKLLRWHCRALPFHTTSCLAASGHCFSRSGQSRRCKGTSPVVNREALGEYSPATTHWGGSKACGVAVLWPQCMSCTLHAKVIAQGQPAGPLSASASISFAQPRRSPASPAASPTARAPPAVPRTRALCIIGASTCP
jgi:hypothetical protein